MKWFLLGISGLLCVPACGSDVAVGGPLGNGGLVAGATGAASCTFGADQSCNDDPAISSLHGHCTAALTCVCDGGIPPEPSGRCAASPMAQGGASAGGASSAGGVAPGGTSGTGVCTFGADQTCNVDPLTSALLGHCNAAGTCVCNDGIPLDASGRCGDPVIGPAGQGGSAGALGTAGCTFGADQTCNVDPVTSAPLGHCSAAGTCVCNDGIPLDASGRCGDPVIGPAGQGGSAGALGAAVCSFGADQSCNADPTISSLHGHCTAAGSCVCRGNTPPNASGLCP